MGASSRRRQGQGEAIPTSDSDRERPVTNDKGRRANGRGGRRPDAPGARDARISREAFIATKRHDLRTPINAIIGYSELLLEEGEELGLAAAEDDLDRVRQAGYSLLAKVNSLLDASKIESGEIDLSDMKALGDRVHHELRNDINTVIGYSEMILEDMDPAQDSAAADLGKIHASAQKLPELIGEIIAFAEVMSGGGFPSGTPAESPGLRDMVETLKRFDSHVRDDKEAPGTILVVDDNAMNRELLARRLAKDGHGLIMAEHGREALDRLAESNVDVVLLDIMMPVMDGYQVLLALRADERLRRIPVIVLSADDQTESVVRCIEIGAEDFLPKPVNPVILTARVESCLQRKRFQDREQAYREEIERERAKSERLLLNILPASVAERLKLGEDNIAERHDEVSVLFADIVGFTPMSATISAEELVGRLNTVFRRFDALVEHHGVEKIKTIGDAYMAVAGVPDPCPDHARRIAELALDCMAALAEINRERELDINIRIGIHAGPVIAGVIGSRKFAYDLWGDTVNTASRMESSGVPGRIHLSEAAAVLLDASHVLIKRGAIQVKGRGTMETYFLEGRREPAP